MLGYFVPGSVDPYGLINDNCYQSSPRLSSIARGAESAGTQPAPPRPPKPKPPILPGGVGYLKKCWDDFNDCARKANLQSPGVGVPVIDVEAIKRFSYALNECLAAGIGKNVPKLNDTSEELAGSDSGFGIQIHRRHGGAARGKTLFSVFRFASRARSPRNFRQEAVAAELTLPLLGPERSGDRFRSQTRAKRRCLHPRLARPRNRGAVRVQERPGHGWQRRRTSHGGHGRPPHDGRGGMEATRERSHGRRSERVA